MRENENKNVIHIRIRDLRRERSLTQEELAAELGISRQSINAMEAGRCLPSLPVAMDIASFFAVPLHHLFAGPDHDDIFGLSAHSQLTSNSERKESPMTRLVPWSPLREMREMLDDMMDETMNVSALPALTIPAANVAQTKDEVHVDLRLPGFKKDDLSIEVGEDFITITGEAKSEEEHEGKQYFRREFVAQNFSRTIALPAPVQTENAEAEMKHGVLSVRLKKVVEEKPKTSKIEIKAE